jgi:hypothetical protein
MSTGDYSEIIGPGWHLSSPGQKRNTGDFTGSQVLTTVVVLITVCLLEMAVRWILIGEGVDAINAT